MNTETIKTSNSTILKNPTAETLLKLFKQFEGRAGNLTYFKVSEESFLSVQDFNSFILNSNRFIMNGVEVIFSNVKRVIVVDDFVTIDENIDGLHYQTVIEFKPVDVWKTLPEGIVTCQTVWRFLESLKDQEIECSFLNQGSVADCFKTQRGKPIFSGTSKFFLVGNITAFLGSEYTYNVSRVGNCITITLWKSCKLSKTLTLAPTTQGESN